MENKFNRFLSLLLAIVMVIGMIPANVVFAAEDDGASDVTVTEDVNGNSEKIQTADVTEPITGTITENMTWNDGDVIGGVNISGNVTITVNGTVTVTGTIRLNPDAISNVTFNGENGAKLIRSGEFTDQMFYAEGVSGNFQNLTFNDITLDGGAVWTGDVDKTLNRGKTNAGVKAASLLDLRYANAKLNESVLQNHDASTAGKASAVYLRYYSSVEFLYSVVKNNNSQDGYNGGGVISVREGGTVKTYNTEVYGNSGDQGGFYGTSSKGAFGGIVEVYNSKFHNNYAASGALFDMQCNSNKGYLLIDGCEFYENASGRGLIYEHAYSRPVTIKDSYFHGNECAVWDCHADPVLNLSGKIVIEEDPDYTGYLFETPLVLGAPLADGSSIPLSAASLAKLGNTIITGTTGYNVTEADLTKLALPEGYSLYLADTNGDGIGDVVSSNNTTQTAITLTLKDMVDASASEEATVYSDINCLPINPFAHEGLIFAGWIDVNGKTVAKQKFAETMTLTATWKLIAPIAKLSREGVTLKVTVTNASDVVTYSYQWYMDDVAIEGATEATYTMSDVNSHTYKCVVTASKEGFESMTGSASGTASAPSVAQVGETNFTSLQDAIAAANAIEGGATITLLSDVTLGEMLTISGNVTISGEHIITRADTYTGTLFTVNTGATLTLDGGLTIDGGNAWSYIKTPLDMDMANGAGTKVANHITPAEDGVNATAHLIVNNGTLNANKVTIQNSYSTNGVSAIDCRASSVTTINGATLQNIAANRSGAVLYVGGADAVLTIKGDTRITGNFGTGNGGIIQNYGQGTTVNLEGGSIDNNHVGSSGTVYASYSNNANKINTFNMSGGIITKNVMEGYGPVYIHTNTVWNMTGGEISENISFLPSYVRSNGNKGTISGGKIVNNEITGTSYSNGYYATRPDIFLGANSKITGGTFTQDVSQWCAEGFKVEKNADGTYGVKKDPTYGKVAVIGDQFYETLAEAIAAAQNGDTITFLADINENVEITKNVTIDGAGKTYTGAMTLKADTTIKNVNFDGKGYNGYAVETRGANYLTIEDCTAKNYGYGFVQLASATVLTTVKNVTASNMNYGVKIDYSNAVVLENVDITAGVAAVLNSNFGEKTVTIKNSKLNILGTWNRFDKTGVNYVTTYVFEGENSIDQFIIDAAIDTFQLALGATLTAPNDITATATEAGYAVKYVDGKYIVKANMVAIGEETYASLNEALAAATAGQTITFLADITEDVEITKNVTIDGAGKTYTGKMTLKADTTIKNVNFDGKGYNGYAVETRGANYLTIEDCTAKNYGYGFVQLASATVLTTVKNVTASNMNYGVKIDYSNAVVLENVDITAGVAAVLNSNFGEKTVTIKNSKLNILGTWNRFDKTGVNYVTTYVFEDENSIDQFIIDAAIDTFQLALGATLTAPEGYNVESAEAAYYVDYVEGTYKLVSFVAQNVQTGKYYATVNAALAEADNEETVILIKDVEERGAVSVLEGVKLDLNGKTLIAGYMSSFGDIIDSSEDNTGLLKVNSTRFLIQKDNAQLPVKDGDGYRFVDVRGFNQKVKPEESKYIFQPLFEEDAHNLLLAGQEATGVTVMIRVSWEQTEGTRSQDFVFNDTMVKNFIESYGAKDAGKYGQQFALTLIGTDAITNLTFTAVVRSSTGVEFTSN